KSLLLIAPISLLSESSIAQPFTPTPAITKAKWHSPATILPVKSIQPPQFANLFLPNLLNYSLKNGPPPTSNPQSPFLIPVLRNLTLRVSLRIARDLATRL